MSMNNMPRGDAPRHPTRQVTMMLGLVGERVLAVEEDLAALVLGCDDDHQPAMERRRFTTTTTTTTTSSGSDDGNNNNNDDDDDDDDNDAADVNATRAAEDGKSGLLLDEKTKKADETRGGEESAASRLGLSSSSSSVHPVAAIAAATCAGLPLPFIRYTAHFSAWITQGVVFVVVIAHFFTSQRTCEFADAPGGGREDNVAPDFVYAIVFCELGLFACFGLTQLAQFVVG